jgi:hypothetical protein
MGELYENCQYRADFSFKLWIIKVFKITSYIRMNFSSLGTKFKQKFKLSYNFELYSLKLTRFYCIKYQKIKLQKPLSLWMETILGQFNLHLFQHSLILYMPF